jgi:hypothetical protein
MVRAKSKHSQLSAADRIEHILATGKLRHADYVVFSTLLLSGEPISTSQREQLTRLFDQLRLGRVVVID